MNRGGVIEDEEYGRRNRRGEVGGGWILKVG